MTNAPEKKLSLREQYPEGSIWQVVKEGAKFDGMQAMREHRSAWEGWQVELPVGYVLTCRGVQWGWGSDPGLEVQWTSDDIPAGVSHVTLRPCVFAHMSVSPVDGYIERIS
jgi:hypothetical protein